MPAAEYASRVEEAARWSEAAAYRGLLVYTDNGILDPWTVAQHIFASTTALRPLVAVQPAYMHPYTAAKKVASLAFLYGRAVDINLVAGGFRNDLRALGDPTPHDERYERVVEYAIVMKQLLDGREPVTFDGAHISVKNLKLTPAVPAELQPQFLVSGSSRAGRDAARAIGALAVRYPQPPSEEDELELRQTGLRHGIRVGIISRDDASEAWTIARRRFPPSRDGQIAHALAMKVSDSEWHKQLDDQPDGGEDALDPYWLEPFKNYGTFCPYLVGSHDSVSAEVSRYLALGVQTIITDIPAEADDLHNARHVVERALTAATV